MHEILVIVPRFFQKPHQFILPNLSNDFITCFVLMRFKDSLIRNACTHFKFPTLHILLSFERHYLTGELMQNNKNLPKANQISINRFNNTHRL